MKKSETKTTTKKRWRPPKNVIWWKKTDWTKKRWRPPKNVIWWKKTETKTSKTTKKNIKNNTKSKSVLNKNTKKTTKPKKIMPKNTKKVKTSNNKTNNKIKKNYKCDSKWTTFFSYRLWKNEDENKNTNIFVIILLIFSFLFFLFSVYKAFFEPYMLNKESRNIIESLKENELIYDDLDKNKQHDDNKTSDKLVINIEKTEIFSWKKILETWNIDNVIFTWEYKAIQETWTKNNTWNNVNMENTWDIVNIIETWDSIIIKTEKKLWIPDWFVFIDSFVLNQKNRNIEYLQKILQAEWYYSWKITWIYDYNTINSVYMLQMDKWIISNTTNKSAYWYLWPKTKNIINSLLKKYK